MPTDLTVVLQDKPGELARLFEVSGAAGLSFHGLAMFTSEEKGFIHVLVEDEDLARARSALERDGMHIADEREVLVLELENHPGRLGEVMRTLADANVNVDLAYTAVGGAKVVIASDDLRNARAAFE